MDKNDFLQKLNENCHNFFTVLKIIISCLFLLFIFFNYSIYILHANPVAPTQKKKKTN